MPLPLSPQGKVQESAGSAGSAPLQVPCGGDRAQPHQEDLAHVSGTAQPAQVSYCMLTCPVGCWGATQKVPLCEVWNKGQLLFPSHGAFPESGAEQHHVSLQWFARPGFQIQMYFSAWNQSLCMGTARCTYKQPVRYLRSMVWQYWVGSAHNYKPAAWEISVRSLHRFLGSFASPNHSLSLQLRHGFWFGLWAHAKICKLANFWDTMYSFPADGLPLQRKRYKSSQRNLSDSIWPGFLCVSSPKLPYRLNYYSMFPVVQSQIQYMLWQQRLRWTQIRSVSVRETK